MRNGRIIGEIYHLMTTKHYHIIKYGLKNVHKYSHGHNKLTFKIFGGMDICALDVLRTSDGCDIALELNDTACGLMFSHEKEDNEHIRDLVLQKLNMLIK